MSVTITDLDAVLGPHKKVRLKGRVYELPADIPAELYLRINQQAQQAQTDTEAIQHLHDAVLELFRECDPKIKKLPISLTQLMVFISTVYGSADEGGDAGPPPTRGTRNSSSRRNGRSRS